jgi:hypothetical protein
MTKTKKWIQAASSAHTKGALHRQLGYPVDQKIPKKVLHDIVGTEIGKHSHGRTVTPLLKKRANFALNVQKRRK